ncbi:unnamed protein product [Chilo suppressalis]|uniref:PX domain-containing protein kinase-like protein n=1 Tax=Chilo suppressalis TaxID=168631 RepID=A0ABN8B5V7_CHISP|nr:unnamed protein product [Chilo suppressalis]
MAIFEKPSQTKAVVDDTEKLICTIENAQNINKHTEYILRVQRGPCKENKWNVSRRYRDFASLHCNLQAANIELPLPPKKLIGNMQPSFVAERQIALQIYINEVLKHQRLSLSLPVRSFLDPKNYSLSIAEQALQTVSIALRGDGHYELKGPLNDIGWRIRKHYFLVTEVENKLNCMLSWQTYGPDKHLSDNDLQSAFKSLQNISHPHIDQILAIHNLESGAYVVRRIHENGSLRDILYGTEYSKNHLVKYGNPKVRKPLTLGQIAHYGNQILQALRFLHDKGMAHGHLHPGNIAIVNQRVLLLDIENILLGVPCLYRPQLLHLRLATPDAVDMYCFGLTLYEMAFATPLEEHYCDNFPEETPHLLDYVLRLCLSRESIRQGGPRIEDLLCHPFFACAHNGLTPPMAKFRFKLPLATKQEIINALSLAETRLRNEQKLVRSVKREVRIQEILNSEEELRKQKRRTKKRQSIWKSTSSLAETVHSHSASTASSPTPPALSVDSGASPVAVSPSTVSPDTGRSALLNAICSFDKSRLSRVDAR